MIEKLELTIYEKDGWTHSIQESVNPDWDSVEQALRAMDKFSRPLLWLFKNQEIPDADLLTVCGGSGVYHVQVEEDESWYEAIDPSGSVDNVEVWLSDQGFSTEKRKTWKFKQARDLVKYYFTTGKRNPKYEWVR